MTLSALPLLALLVACGGGPEKQPDGAATSDPPTEAAPEAEPTADGNAAVLAALSVRKPEPRCQDVDQLSPDPMGAYRAIIANEAEPPFLPMRAATCLLSQHPRDAEVDALAWVTDPAKSSLTTVALQRLDTLPLESAKKIAAAALAGPHKDIAKVKIARLRTPELKAMASAGAP